MSGLSHRVTQAMGTFLSRRHARAVLTYASCFIACALVAGAVGPARAQDMAYPDSYGGGYEAGPPQYASGGGSFFNQQLNTHLRVRYNSQSYGQGEGNFDIGTMKIFDLGDASMFVDGQVTMNDVDGVGYNVGVGYRWLEDQTFAWDPDPQRVMGLSIWSDGSPTMNDHFFTQLGLSFEALGEAYDFRSNLYIPLGNTVRDGDYSTTGTNLFQGNGLAQQTAAVRDTALNVGEFEVAKRWDNRDAWGFAGAYFLAGDGFDTAGGRIGARGYIFPDLLLQVAINHDDLFDTNAVFSAVWFIGRTRNDYCATCSVADRLREPVYRNDYVAVNQSTAFSSTPLTVTDGAATPNNINIVHVDSTAAAGGDGTFEAPLNSVADINANSAAGDVVLLHSGSVFTDQSVALQDDQRLLGEGLDAVHTIATTELGVTTLPATARNALSGDAPTIRQTGGGTSVTLATGNTVDNVEFDGGTGIASTATIGTANLQNLQFSGSTAGISLTDTIAGDRVNVSDSTFDSFQDGIVLANAAGSADIDNVTMTNGTGEGITFDLATTATTPNVRVTNSEITTADASALVFASNNTDSFDVLFELDQNTFTNNSAGSATVDIDANGTEVLMATVTNNTMSNTGGGLEYMTDTNNAGGGIELLLQGNAVVGAGEFELNSNAGQFIITDQADLNTDNPGVTITPAGPIANQGTAPTRPF